jgi:hypothetical protein
MHRPRGPQLALGEDDQHPAFAQHLQGLAWALRRNCPHGLQEPEGTQVALVHEQSSRTVLFPKDREGDKPVPPAVVIGRPHHPGGRKLAAHPHSPQAAAYQLGEASGQSAARDRGLTRGHDATLSSGVVSHWCRWPTLACSWPFR